MNIFLTILKKTYNKLAFRTVEITFIIHETENTTKFLSNLCSILDVSDTDFNKKITEGHHGNKIELIRAHFIRNRVDEITEKILLSLNINDLSILNTDLLDYLDDKFTLYLSLIHI